MTSRFPLFFFTRGLLDRLPGSNHGSSTCELCNIRQVTVFYDLLICKKKTFRVTVKTKFVYIYIYISVYTHIYVYT